MGKEYWGKKFYESRLNTVLLLVLIVLMIFAIFTMRQIRQENSSYPPFISVLIKNGTDQIYKYQYRQETYYFTTDWEVVGRDGTPEVYNSNGVQIDCNFGSPISPIQQEPNPICKDYESGEIIYKRK